MLSTEDSVHSAFFYLDKKGKSIDFLLRESSDYILTQKKERSEGLIRDWKNKMMMWRKK